MFVLCITSFVCFLLLCPINVKGQQCNPCSVCNMDPQRCDRDSHCVFMPLTGDCRTKASEDNGCVADVLYGGVKFYKIGEEDTSSLGCKDENVYEREGAKGSRICFKEKVGSMQRECSSEASYNIVEGRKFEGTVYRTIQNVDSPESCEKVCRFRRQAGFSYDTGEESPTYKDCILFSAITSTITLADWVSSYCRRSGDDSCISEAMDIAITHCEDDCEASEENCSTCVSEKLEGNCSNVEEFSLFGDEPWKCLYDVPKCVYECVRKSHNPFDIVVCVTNCVPGECEKYVCDALGKVVGKLAQQACICLPTLIPLVQNCRKDNPDSWPKTVECVVEKVLDGPCISVLCYALKYLFPEAPEAVQVCQCAVPIITSVQKCHDNYGSNWVKVVECVEKVVGKDCKQYLCKYAGKIFPPILQVPPCKSSARLPY